MKKNYKKITKKEFIKGLVKKTEKLVAAISILMVVYFILCYVDVVANNVELNKELAGWSVLHDYKMEMITK